ncbi:MAG: pallilysin-related adhesin [Spirochaetes bacterium]|nr:pallilysin-related adhesin [Spirochaetota bacterium]
MMKRFAQRLFLVISALAVGVIAWFVVQAFTPGPSLADQPVVARSRNALDGQSPSGESEEPVPGLPTGIEIGSDRMLLDVFRFNLDSDEADEQLLVVKPTKNPDDPITIVMIDYDEAARAWKFVWEGPSSVTKIKTVQVSVKDLIGDHNLDIIVEGINDSGQRTMNVFWRTISGATVSYAPICSIAADSIEVVETDRPDSYKLGQSNAEAFQLVAYRPDPDSSNLTDQIRETWEWRFRTTRYELSRLERVPGAQIEQKFIAGVLDGKAETFEGFLEGVWYKSPADGDDERETHFIIFDPSGKAVHFHTASLLESYSWDDSHLTRLGLFIGGRNLAVRNLKRMVDIELKGLDRISVRVMQSLFIKADPSARWNGVYQRVGQTMAESNAKPAALVMLDGAKLSGGYVSESGVAFNFAWPDFTYNDGTAEERGNFSLYTIEKETVLELAFVTKEGRLDRRASYLVQPAGEPGTGVSTLPAVTALPAGDITLVPIRLTLNGPELLESLPIRLRKPR